MFRRDLLLFLKSLKYALIIGCIFLAVCAGTAAVISKSEAGGGKMLTLALVNEDTNSSFSDFVLNIVATNENISSAVDVEFYDTEEEAVRAVKNGAAAALIIPENFFASVNYGENYPCRIILNQSNLSAAEAINYFAGLGSDMLSAAQYAVYEGDLFLRDKGADDSVRLDYNIRLNTSMVSEVAGAPERYFEQENLGYTTNGLSRYAHYAVLFMCFFFGLLSVCFFHLYRDDCERDILTRLFAAGVSKKRFVLWKAVLPGAAFLLLSGIVIFAGGKWLPVEFDISGILLAACGIVFLALFCACFSISFGDFSGAVLFVIFFVSLFFCGGIIPYSGISETALTIGKYTPLGVAYAFFSPLFSGRFDPLCLIPAAIYLAGGVLLVRSTLIRTVLGGETV